MTINPVIIAAAQKAHAKYYPRGPFVSVTIAQCGEESGWLAHMSGKNNCFGIKATSAQIAAGKATKVPTREENANGQSYMIYAYFADYDTLYDCFDAHAALLCSPHYKACQDAQTPEAYCDALQSCGYATAHNYASALKNLISTMNLKKYDLSLLFPKPEPAIVSIATPAPAPVVAQTFWQRLWAWITNV